MNGKPRVQVLVGWVLLCCTVGVMGAELKWDILDQTYGNGPGQVSFNKTYTYNWSQGTTQEGLADGRARLTGRSGETGHFYACLASIPGLPQDDLTIEFKAAVVSPATYLNVYASNTADKSTATMSHILQINKIYDQPAKANIICDYNQRDHAANAAPADFQADQPHVYRLVRRHGATSLYLDGKPKPVIEKLAEGAGAAADKQMFVFGFSREEDQDLAVEFYYLRVASGAHVPNAADAQEPEQKPASPGETAATPMPAEEKPAPAPAPAPAAWRQEVRATLANVGDRKQLLIDDLLFDQQTGIALRVHPARKTGQIILKPEKAWESASLNWFSVMEDGPGKYRMWYECYDIDGWPTGDDTSFCYAESTDGVTWTRPALGLFAYKGDNQTNILFRLIGPAGARSRVHGTGVFKDPNGSDETRYKAVSQGVFEGVGTPPHRIAGMQSPDGIHWTRLPEPICPVFADSQYSCFWDSSLNKYVLYGRVAGAGRAIGRSQSADFAHFEPLKFVMERDERDIPETDVYNSAAMKYPYAENVYFMFPSMYHHREDTLDIHLAVSRDGIHWTRPEVGVPFIPLGTRDEFDSGSLYMGQGIIRKGDELWQYYSGGPLKHQEAELENLTKPGNSRLFSRVVIPADRYVSADAAEGGGSFETLPLTFAGNILKLNVEARQGGEVRVALLDEKGSPIRGRSIEDCRPITGDQPDAKVVWKDGADVTARAGKPTRLRIELKNASVYAFQFTVGDAGFGRDH